MVFIVRVVDYVVKYYYNGVFNGWFIKVIGY